MPKQEPICATSQVIEGAKTYIDQLYTFLERQYLLVGPPDKQQTIKLSVMPEWPTISRDIDVLVVATAIVIEGVRVPIVIRISRTTLRVLLGGFAVWQQNLTLSDSLWRMLDSVTAPGEPVVVPGTSLGLMCNLVKTNVAASYAKSTGDIDLKFSAPLPRVGKGVLWAEIHGLRITKTTCTVDVQRKILGFDLIRDPVFTWG